MLGRPDRRELARAFRWGYSYKGPQLAQRLGRRAVSLSPGPAASTAASTAQRRPAHWQGSCPLPRPLAPSYGCAVDKATVALGWVHGTARPGWVAQTGVGRVGDDAGEHDVWAWGGHQAGRAWGDGRPRRRRLRKGTAAPAPSVGSET